MYLLYLVFFPSFSSTYLYEKIFRKENSFMKRSEQIENESFIEREERQKKEISVLWVLGGVIYLVASYMLAHFMHVSEACFRETAGERAILTFKSMFTTPLAIFPMSSGTVTLWGFVTAILGCVVLLRWQTHKMRRHDDVEKVNGEAKLMDAKDLKKYNMRRSDPLGSSRNDGPYNIILSQDLMLSLDNNGTRRNCNMLIIGRSGSGKSRFVVGPNILQYNTNLVITDPSGDLLAQYGKGLENNGYKIRVFNLVEMNKSSKYNPFAYIHEEKDIFVLVNTLIKNTNPKDKSGGDPFWEKCEKLLLQSIILYIWHTKPIEEQTFAQVIKCIDMAEVDENDTTKKSKLDEEFDMLKAIDPNNLAVLQYNNFKKAAGKTLKSIIISVVARMESFMLGDIQRLTSADEMDFETFADEKCALFVIIPAEDTTFNFLVSLMYSQLFMTLYNYCGTRVKYGWYVGSDVRHIYKVFQAYSKNDPVIDGKDNSETAKVKAQKWIDDIKNHGIEIKEENGRYELWGKFTDPDGNVKESMITCRQDETHALEEKRHLESITKPSQFKVGSVRCPQHVRFILDEFANVGEIPEFDNKLSTIRKYDISCSIFIQALSQLKAMYKDKWNTIIANCDTKIDLGCDDPETVDWLVKMLGKKTTKVQNESYSVDKSGNTSINRSSRDLLTHEQLSGMQDDKCVVCVYGEHPHFGSKYEITKHPNYEYAHSHIGEFEVPINSGDFNSHIPLRLRMKEMAQKASSAGADAEGSSEERTSTASKATPATKIGAETEKRYERNDAVHNGLVDAVNARNAEKNMYNRKKNVDNSAALKALREGYASSKLAEQTASALSEAVNSAKTAIKEASATSSQEEIDEHLETSYFSIMTPAEPEAIEYHKTV